MGIVGIDHVQLAMPVGGEEQARAFYAGLLGIPEIAKPQHLARRGGCWFERGVLKIHLGVEHDFLPARKAHPALLVSGISAMRNSLVGAGIPVIDDEPLPGFARFYAEDPFGNRLEFLEQIEAVPLAVDPEMA